MRPARFFVVLLFACSSADSAPAPAPAAPHHAVVPANRVVTAPARLGDATAAGTVIAAHIVAAIDDGPATDRPAYARADQQVALFAVLEIKTGSTRTFASDAAAITLGGKKITAVPLAKAPVVELSWNRIEPVSANISNGDASTFHFHTIEYQPTAIVTGPASITPDVRPTLTPDHGNGVGTMRYQLVVRQGDRTVATPGPEARRGKGSGGLTDAVMRVSIRRDDSYLGYLTEMYGQPYIWASAGLSVKSHQSERLEGSDCADFIVYGARRMGANIPYTWTGALPQVTKLLAGAGTRGDDGIYYDRRGEPLPFTQIGDLVLFPRHVGVLTEDRGTAGVLDDQDLMMHTLFDSPKQQAIANSGYADTAVEVRRFRQDLRRGR